MAVELERQIVFVECDVEDNALAVNNQRNVSGRGDQLRCSLRSEISERFGWRFEHLHQGKYPPARN
ncbi:hypothetical protein NP284_19045 [Rhodopseudomonas pseudopalustris]